MSDTNSTAAAEGEPAWLAEFRKFQLGIVAVGLALNILGLLVLFFKASKSFSAMTLILLKHQSLIDTTICVMNVMYLIPQLPDSSNVAVACYLWYSQTFYWYLVVLGVWNLLLICVERFLAVVLPIRYKSKKTHHVIMMVCGIHVWAALLAVPVTFYVKHQDGVCQFGVLTFDSPVLAEFLKVHAALWFLGIYLVPMLGMSAMYAKIIWAIRAATRGVSGDGGDKQNSAASDFTKTAIVVTTVFIVSFSFDSFYYFIGTFDPTIEYQVNSPLQAFGTFMVTVNSCANIVIYIIFMKSFRRHVMDLISCGKWKPSDVGGATSITNA